MVTLDRDPPAFVSLPVISDVGEDSVELELQLDEPGVVYYWIQYADMYTNLHGVGVAYEMATIELEEARDTEAVDFHGAVVATGQIPVEWGRQEIVVTLRPKCLEELCPYMRYALMPMTSYQVCGLDLKDYSR